MGTRQIRHMDITANPGPIRRGIVSTKAADMAAFAQRCFYRHLDELGCPRCRLSGATFRISARHIVVAQVPEVETLRTLPLTHPDLVHQLPQATSTTQQR